MNTPTKYLVLFSYLQNEERDEKKESSEDCEFF